MPTAAVFAELFVAGLQASVWVLLLALPHIPISTLGWLAGALETTGAALCAIAYIYALGIVVDRVSDSLFARLDSRLQRTCLKSASASEPTMRLTVFGANDGRAQFLNYARSRVRVARAAALNSTLVSFALFHNAASRGNPLVNGIGLSATLASACAVLIFAACCLLTWRRISLSYYARLQESYTQVTRRAASPCDSGGNQPGETRSGGRQGSSPDAASPRGERRAGGPTRT